MYRVVLLALSSALSQAAAAVPFVAAGANHSLFLKSDGTMWAWGSNQYGQLGDGTTTNRSSPVQVSGLTGVVMIAAGGFQSLAVKSDGTVWAWGSINAGVVGAQSAMATRD